MSNQKAKYPKLVNLDSVQNRELKRIKQETGIDITVLIRTAINDLININLADKNFSKNLKLKSK